MNVGMDLALNAADDNNVDNDKKGKECLSGKKGNDLNDDDSGKAYE